MLTLNTLAVARNMASSLTEAHYQLLPKGEQFPLGAVYPHFKAPVKTFTDRDDLSFEVVSSLTEHFQASVGDENTVGSDEIDTLSTNMAQGLLKTLNTAQKVITPTCRQIRKEVDEFFENDAPVMRVQPLKISAIHNEPVLVDRMIQLYAHVRPRDTYDSVDMRQPTRDRMVEWLCASGVLDEDVVRPWALSVSEESLTQAYMSVFFLGRGLTLQDIYNPATALESLDIALARYLLVSYLKHHPQDVRNESLSLAQWEERMRGLEMLTGIALCRGYQRRADFHKEGRLVIRYESRDDGGHRSLEVTVNPDVYTQWLNKGGEVEALLGAAAINRQTLYMGKLLEEQTQLVKEWERAYYLIRQRNVDRRVSRLRNFLVGRVISANGPMDGDEGDGTVSLPRIDERDAYERARRLVNQMSEAQINDTWRAIVTLVCEVYYPKSLFRNFMESMYDISLKSPEMAPREVASIAAVEMLAQWLWGQLDTQKVTTSEVSHGRPVPA